MNPYKEIDCYTTVSQINYFTFVLNATEDLARIGNNKQTFYQLVVLAHITDLSFILFYSSEEMENVSFDVVITHSNLMNTSISALLAKVLQQNRHSVQFFLKNWACRRTLPGVKRGNIVLV